MQPNSSLIEKDATHERVIQVDYGWPGQQAALHIAAQGQDLVEVKIKPIDPNLTNLNTYPKDLMDGKTSPKGYMRQVANIDIIKPGFESSEEQIDGKVELYITWTPDDFINAGGHPRPWYFDKRAEHWKPFDPDLVSEKPDPEHHTGTFIIRITHYGDPAIGVNGKR